MDPEPLLRITPHVFLDDAGEQLRQAPHIFFIVARPFDSERFVNLHSELSVIAARGLNGEMAEYAPFENRHRNHILDMTTAPAAVPEPTARRAIEIAHGYAAISFLTWKTERPRPERRRARTQAVAADEPEMIVGNRGALDSRLHI